MAQENQNYDKDYIEACFRVWYDAGAPGLLTATNVPSIGGVHIMKVIPPYKNGKKPNITTIRKWMDDYAWRERADALDAEVSIQLDRESIEKRIETLKTLAESGKSLREKGLKYINDAQDPFYENPSAAVRAIVAGAEMEFKFAGAADRLAIINGMSNKQIEDKILLLLGKESRESESNENEEQIIDSALEEIPREDDDTENDNP